MDFDNIPIVKSGSVIVLNGRRYTMERQQEPYYSISECGEFFQEHWLALEDLGNGKTARVNYIHMLPLVRKG